MSKPAELSPADRLQEARLLPAHWAPKVVGARMSGAASVLSLLEPSATERLREDYNPDEPRDPDGKWSGGGGGGPPYTQDQKDAVEYFTGPSYQVLNPWLRGVGPPGQYTAEMTQHLDAALASHVLTADTTLFRGVDGQLNYQPGQVFTDKGFLSTSLSQSIGNMHIGGGPGLAGDFRSQGPGTLVQISAPAGSSAINVNEALFGSPDPSVSAQAVGKSDALQEVILPRDSAFQVTSVAPGVVSVDYLGHK